MRGAKGEEVSMKFGKFGFLSALVLASSWIFIGCEEDEEDLYGCKFPTDSMGATLTGDWAGTAILNVEGASVAAPLTVAMAPVAGEGGACDLAIDLKETQWFFCGREFAGSARWVASSGNWEGIVEGVEGSSRYVDTTFAVKIRSAIGDRLALNVEITQSENAICVDRTIQGDLSRDQ